MPPHVIILSKTRFSYGISRGGNVKVVSTDFLAICRIRIISAMVYAVTIQAVEKNPHHSITMMPQIGMVAKI